VQGPANLRRYLAANLVLLLGIGLLWGIVYPARQPPSEAAQEQASAARLGELVAALPQRAGPWQAHPLELDPQVAEFLRYDWAAARNYTLGDQAIWLYALRSRSEKAFLLRAHTPPACAISQGWGNISVQPESLTVAGAPVAAQRMLAEKNGVHEVVFYWEFPGWHVDGRGQRVADVTTVQAGAVVTASSEQTAAMLREFLATLSPAVTLPQDTQQADVARLRPGEDSLARLLAVNLTSRSVRAGSTLGLTTWWAHGSRGHTTLQLVAADGSVWGQHSVPLAAGDGASPACLDVALDVPEQTPIGLYDVRLIWQSEAAGQPQPFVDPGGALVTQVLEPLVVKPRQPVQMSDLAIRHPLQAALGEEVALLGYDLAWREPGRVLDVTLYWQARQSMEVDYKVFVHLLGPQGQIIAQHDSWPVENRYATSLWDVGEIVSDRHSLVVGDLPAGRYQIAVGMYDLRTLARLSAIVNGQPAPENRLLLPVGDVPGPQ
jgi:hypothetical protein